MEMMRDLKCNAKAVSAISSKFLPPIERSIFMRHLSTFISVYWTLDIYLPTVDTAKSDAPQHANV